MQTWMHGAGGRLDTPDIGLITTFHEIAPRDGCVVGGGAYNTESREIGRPSLPAIGKAQGVCELRNTGTNSRLGESRPRDRIGDRSSWEEGSHGVDHKTRIREVGLV